MTPAFWAILLRPFVALFIFGLVLLPIRLTVKRWLPEGKLKRFLLWEVKKSRSSRRPQ